MRQAILAPALILLACNASSCASWQTTTARSLLTAADAAQSTHAIGRKALHARCLAIAKQCPAKPAACPALAQCQDVRRRFDAAVKLALSSIDAARVALLAAIAAGGEGDAKAKALAAATTVGRELAALLRLAQDVRVVATSGRDGGQ